MRSPTPASPAKVSGLAPGGDPEAGHLGQPAGQQPGLAVVAEPERVGGAGGDGDDVLERAAQLDAEDVAVDVEPELAPAEPRHDPLREVRIRRRDDGRRRQAPGDLGAPGSGPDRAAIRAAARPAAAAITSLIRSRLPASRPLTTDRQVGLGATGAAATAATVARRWRDGAAKITRSTASARSPQSVRGAPPLGQVDPGQAASFRRVRGSCARRLGEWHSRVTGSTPATSRASVVPQAPAPTTATRGPAISVACGPPRACPDAPGRAALPRPPAGATGALRELLRAAAA